METRLTAGLSCRPASGEDIAWLTNTYIVSMQSAIVGARGYWDEAKERDQFRNQLRLSDTTVLIVGEQPVGFYTAWLEIDHLFLGTLCVLPEYQRRGIGALAMCAIAKRCGKLPVRLSVLKANSLAKRFYDRLGCYCTSSSEYHHHLLWPNNAMHATCEGARA